MNIDKQQLPSNSSPRPQGVVFDLDGTLVDSRRDIAVAANHALAACGFATLTHAELESYVGDGASLLLARAARIGVEHVLIEKLMAEFLDYYSAHPIDYTELMPGAREALAALDHYPLGLCTNKPRRTTEKVLEGLDLGGHFKSVVAGDDLPQKKPDPAMVRHSAELLGVPAAGLVMVGDGPQDILSGRGAGAFTVGVRGGIQAIERLLAAKPDVVIDSLSELPALISSLAAR
mgnify:CR=1 FL=1